MKDFENTWNLPSTSTTDFDVIEPVLSTRCALVSLLASDVTKCKLPLCDADVTSQVLQEVQSFAIAARDAKRWQVRRMTMRAIMLISRTSDRCSSPTVSSTVCERCKLQQEASTGSHASRRRCCSGSEARA